MSGPPQRAEEILAKILNYFAGRSGPIAEDMRIYHDLGIGGDDASELLEEIHSTYGTLWTGLQFDTYFPNEGEVFWKLWARRFGVKEAKLKPMTVRHLLDVIARGNWFDPPAGNPVT